MSHTYPGTILSLFASASLLMAADGGETVPDFPKGDPMPQGFSYDWNLGPTGARGWIYSSLGSSRIYILIVPENRSAV